jgi:hypothetical protein
MVKSGYSYIEKYFTVNWNFANVGKTIKPTMTGDGLQTTHKHGDDLGIVCDIGFTTLIAWFLMRIPL